MYPMDFGRALTDEEKLLRVKYQQLRELKERLELAGIEVPVVQEEESSGSGSERDSSVEEEEEEEEDQEHQEEEATEKAKQLIRSGQISIEKPEEKKDGFKKAKVLENRRKERSSSGENGASKVARVEGESFQNMEYQLGMKNAQASSTLRPRPGMSPQPSTSSSAALSWKDSVPNEAASGEVLDTEAEARQARRDYIDFKRRLIKYNTDSSDEDD